MTDLYHIACCLWRSHNAERSTLTGTARDLAWAADEFRALGADDLADRAERLACGDARDGDGIERLIEDAFAMAGVAT